MNLQWYCNDCVPYTINGTFNGILNDLKQSSDYINQVMHTNNTQFSNASQSNTPKTDESNRVDDLQTQSDAHISQQQRLTTDSQPIVDADAERSTHNITTLTIDMLSADEDDSHNSEKPQTRIKRKRMQDETKGNGKRQKSNDVHAPAIPQLSDFVLNNVSESHSNEAPNSISNSNSNSNSMRLRDVYLSNFRNDTHESLVLGHLNNYDLTRDFSNVIVCKKLVHRNDDAENYSYLSFKLTVPDECFNFVMDPSIWPTGIVVKEFIIRDKSKTNFKRQPTPLLKSTKPDKSNNTKKREFKNTNNTQSTVNQKNFKRRSQTKFKPKWRVQNTSENHASQKLVRKNKIKPKPLPFMNPYQMLFSQLFQTPFNNMQM